MCEINRNMKFKCWTRIAPKVRLHKRQIVLKNIIYL